MSLTLCFQSSFGQTGASDSTQSKTEHENEPDNQNRLFFSPGFVYQNIFMGEVGIIYGIKVEGRGYNRLRQYSVLSGVKLSMEFSLTLILTLSVITLFSVQNYPMKLEYYAV